MYFYKKKGDNHPIMQFHGKAILEIFKDVTAVELFMKIRKIIGNLKVMFE